MNAVRSYCCASVPSVRAASSKTISRCPPRRFFGLGIGVTNATLRRSGRILSVGWPLPSSSQWRDGYSYGEFRIGRSKNPGFILRQGGPPVGPRAVPGRAARPDEIRRPDCDAAPPGARRRSRSVAHGGVCALRQRQRNPEGGASVPIETAPGGREKNTRVTRREKGASRACQGSAKTKRLLPALGRSSGVRRMNPEAVAAEPVLTATYCRPATA